MKCPLCDNSKSFYTLQGQQKRVFQECENCRLIFTESKFFPSLAEERSRYLSHNNGIQYPGYVNFLKQIIEPSLPFLSANMRGLDYGCGPMPTLSILLKNEGLLCLDYDPLFFPVMPDGLFDFIFATECFEHFHKPGKEIEKISGILKPGGYLMIMTTQWESRDNFSSWYYTNDLTHVSFYHKNTFDYIADEYGFSQKLLKDSKIVILKKN